MGSIRPGMMKWRLRLIVRKKLYLKYIAILVGTSRVSLESVSVFTGHRLEEKKYRRGGSTAPFLVLYSVARSRERYF